ncbi:uncharacterized protein VTP21DRAFT_636 [Calcarisporiella thermophila]|uniref:uncharacterized protein n=1 Tax=Calcarisporiella thermophila TaxID=911321 RepID=UPI0037434B9B
MIKSVVLLVFMLSLLFHHQVVSGLTSSCTDCTVATKPTRALVARDEETDDQSEDSESEVDSSHHMVIFQDPHSQGSKDEPSKDKIVIVDEDGDPVTTIKTIPTASINTPLFNSTHKGNHTHHNATKTHRPAWASLRAARIEQRLQQSLTPTMARPGHERKQRSTTAWLSMAAFSFVLSLGIGVVFLVYIVTMIVVSMERFVFRRRIPGGYLEGKEQGRDD